MLRIHLNLGTLVGLPSTSAGPSLTAVGGLSPAQAQQVLEAGYDGVQEAAPGGASRTVCEQFETSIAGVIPENDLRDFAYRSKDRGHLLATVITGDGFESDDDAARIVETFLEAEAAAEFPMNLETHRGSVTQDPFRTARLLERFPELRLNGDFSHWVSAYSPMPGGIAELSEVLGLVCSRTASLHGRMSDASRVQLSLADAVAVKPLFEELWRRCLRNAANSARPFIFAPELLSPLAGYAPFAASDSSVAEASDRFADASSLQLLARDLCGRRIDNKWEALSYEPSADLNDVSLEEYRTSSRCPELKGRARIARVDDLSGFLEGAASGDAWLVKLGSVADDEAKVRPLLEALLDKADACGVRVLLETSRGTVAHDPVRAQCLTEYEPRVRFALNFGEWHFGGEFLLNPPQAIACTRRLLPFVDAVAAVQGTAEKLRLEGPSGWNTMHHQLARAIGAASTLGWQIMIPPVQRKTASPKWLQTLRAQD
ncbi:MAG: hypothetical protein HRU17_05245 [Polyangiaceae bacterium]|nr:hypothetical protein [Polyangiaceae bacterium]